MAKLTNAPRILVGKTEGKIKDNEILDSINGTDFPYISIRTLLHTLKIYYFLASLIPHKLRAQFYDGQKI